ncbi:MAG: DUF3857 domain-containing transglutaminase family protein [Bacteroidales bacterium]|nr:DUF3857 domain-containing transglutaminase family protein [Bacteroidales bacterium]
MNKHFSLLLTCLFIFNLNTWAKKEEIKYPTSSISEELKKDAHTVTRLDKTIFTIESTKNATLTKHEVITILDKNGEYACKKVVSYDKLLKLKSFRINIYDAEGKLIKKVKSSDIKDYSATSGGTLFDDNRVKYYEALQNNYPFTIEYEYEREFDGILSYPEWFAINGYDRSVEEAEYIVNIPQELQLRTKTYLFDGEYEKSNSEGMICHRWAMKNIKAFKSEPFSPDFQNIVPRVVTAPVEFEMEGFKGTQDSWQNFGNWMRKLNANRILLPPETVNELGKLTSDCKTDFEKVKSLYQYMQSKTRYVSIQLGIGGWQPFPAETVDKLGYGDCKALSNYMKALLHAVGIHSYYTLVEAGSGNHHFDKDFVKNQFNHAILMVPLAQDSIWLECTSQQQACGFLGSFTNDRDVLIIKEDGGELIHTPIYTANQNTQERLVEVIIQEGGNATANAITHYSGLQYENLRSIYYDGLEDQKKALYKSIKLSDFTINKLVIEQEKKRIPESELELELSIKNYLSKTGERLFMPLNLMNRKTYIPKKLKERKTPIVLDYPYSDTDTIYYTLPANLMIESLPKTVNLNTEFGKYSSQIIVNENRVTYIRNYEMYKGEFSADKYEALRKFFKAIVKADKAKLILKPKTEGA